jgi:septum site-determining protein MinC
MAFVLKPVPPVVEWLADLDTWIGNSAGFFVGRPAVLDLSGVTLSASAVAHLVSELASRDIRLMGIEGMDPTELGTALPPVLTGGRPSTDLEPVARSRPVSTPALAPRQEPTCLLLDTPVRSGQSVVFPNGDVTVLGSIASGAEVIAGGSIHVYGALRGRAMAGLTGNRRARIFCSRDESELLAIDGFYRTAEDIDENLRNRPVQVWLEGEALIVAPLD